VDEIVVEMARELRYAERRAFERVQERNLGEAFQVAQDETDGETHE
jgi:hypothetical protein